VQGSERTPYRTHVDVKELSDADWERFLDTVAERAVHIAALLDKDMPPELIEDSTAAGVRLLPGRGDIDPGCSCPDWGWPCKHAAALCYQIARLLDVDPFVLLLLRGRGEQELMGELRKRNATRASAETAAVGVVAGAVTTRSDVSPAGVAAKTVFADWQPPAEPLAPPEPVAVAGTGPVLASSKEPDGFDPTAVEVLAADAAVRAKALLDVYLDAAPAASGDVVPALPDLSVWQDSVRIATAHTEYEIFHRLAEAADGDGTRLAMAVIAWRHGGVAALEVLEHPWTPSAADKARALAALENDGDVAELPALKVWRNRWTAEREGAQARLGQEGRWWPFRCDEDGRWWPAGPAEKDPVAALSAVLDGTAG
jgi:hypothetical protein